MADATTSKTEADKRWWHRLGFWRGLATANGLLTVALVAFVGVGVLQQEPPVPSELVYVGVLSDPENKPGVAVLAYNNPFRLEITAKAALTASPDSELRLWIRERDTDTPVFLAAIPAGKKTFTLDDKAWKLLRRAKALMITRKTAGSPVSTPGQDVLYEGVCVNLKKWSDSGSGGQPPPQG